MIPNTVPGPLDTPESIARFSSERGEPSWLKEYRIERLESFRQSPPEDGRYTRLKLNWKDLPAEMPSFPFPRNLGEGLMPATSGAEAPGLALAPWAESHPDVFRALARPRQPFDNLVFSSWAYGLVFQWPAGQRDETIRYLAPETKAGLVIEPLLMDVAEGGGGQLALHWKGGDERGLRLTTISGRVAAGGSLKLVLLREGGSGHHTLSLNLELGEGARVEVFGVWLGGAWTVLRGEAALGGRGASWKETHLVWGDGKDHTDLETKALHLAPGTKSDIHVRTALAGNARSVFTGNVVIEKEAVQGDARLEDHALLLSEGARSDSVPGLVIRAMDVRASHAASTGPVDPESLFYLLSRGLDESQARRLLVAGFLSCLMERAPFPFLSDRVETALEERVIA
jgi:Fe-S cluster assembly protein SufD